MTALAAPRFLVTKEGLELSVPMKDNVKIWKGSLVMYDTNGYALPAADTASNVFAGIAIETADNTIVGHVAGGVSVRVQTGCRVTLPGSGFAQSSVGAGAYVTDS